GQGLAHHGSFTLHEIEDTRGHAGGVQDVCENLAGERRNLRGLEHHRTARGQRRRHLGADLVDGPVPGGDEGADTDRLTQDATRAAVFFEAEVLQDADGGLEVVD